MYYGVIAILEDIESSLCVMEGYIPLFFKGAVQIYNTLKKVQEHQNHKETRKKYLGKNVRMNRTKSFVKNRTPNKKEISELARSILAARMPLEYDFYKFIRQRLQLQKEHLIKQNFHCLTAGIERQI